MIYLFDFIFNFKDILWRKPRKNFVVLMHVTVVEQWNLFTELNIKINYLIIIKNHFYLPEIN